MNHTKELFVIVPFPDVQSIMKLDGFEDNSCLINNSPLVNTYGNSAYFVSMTWLSQIKYDIK